MTSHIFVALPIFAGSIRRTYISIYRRHFEISDWELSSSSDLLIGRGYIPSMEFRL
jgi:hypothetical protein